MNQTTNESGLRLAIKECRLRESYAMRNVADVERSVQDDHKGQWQDNTRRDYAFWKHEEELSRALRMRCEKLLELDSAGFEMHTFECLCSLDDNDEDCTCGAYRRNQERLAPSDMTETEMIEFTEAINAAIPDPKPARVYQDAVALMSGTAEKDVAASHREPVIATASCVQCWHPLCEQCKVEADTQGRVLRCCRCQYLTDYTRGHLGLTDDLSDEQIARERRPHSRLD